MINTCNKCLYKLYRMIRIFASSVYVIIYMFLQFCKYYDTLIIYIVMFG